MSDIGNFSDTKLQSVDLWADCNPSVLSSPTAKMDLLHTQLARQGLTSEGMSWSLLLLEWKYDLVVLFENFHDWIRYIDRRFDNSGE